LIGWDAETEDIDELEDLLIRYRPKLFCTTTTFRNPSGGVWPVALRKEVLELARRYKVPIIEDEPYRELSFGERPPPSLYDLDASGIVIHIGTFSKTLASGMRIAWVLAHESIIEQLALIKNRVDVSTSTLTQQIVADFLTSGVFDHHRSVLNAEHLTRHNAMVASLRKQIAVADLRFRPVAGGIFLWCRLGDGLSALDLERIAPRHGIAVVAGDHFYPDGAGRDFLRLCFTAVPANAIEEGCRRLGLAFAELRSTRANPTLPMQ
jgi:DNA-binding transcriptional MocR family regulator